MEYSIIVYKQLINYAIPIAEIRWTGPPPNSLRFAHRHGGDFVEIKSLEEYVETLELV